MKKVGIVSLGCAKNLIDSESILGMFDTPSFEITSSPSEADFIIVNTCGFISSAKKESIDTILEMAKYDAKLIVTGCLVERYEGELKKELPEVSAFIPLSSYDQLKDRLVEITGISDIMPFSSFRRVLSSSSYSAYLRISEGCDNFCSFCAIPYIRGRFKSRPIEEILEEARQLKQRGVKEISLISQDTTIYGIDFPSKKPDIVDLLKELENIGFYSIRLLYLYPSEISLDLIKYIASSKQVAHYFDIPVQCASDHLLKLMNRHGDMAQMKKLFKDIKEICPDAILRTTLIAGFPGENEDDLRQTKEFLEEVEFDHMGCFTYSREEGTASYSYPNQISEPIKAKRKEELMKLQQAISFKKALGQVNKVFEGIVISSRLKDGSYKLRSSWNAPDEIDGDIYFSSKRDLKEGDIVKVRITSAFTYDLAGEEVYE